MENRSQRDGKTDHDQPDRAEHEDLLERRRGDGIGMMERVVGVGVTMSGRGHRAERRSKQPDRSACDTVREKHQVRAQRENEQRLPERVVPRTKAPRPPRWRRDSELGADAERSGSMLLAGWSRGAGFDFKQCAEEPDGPDDHPDASSTRLGPTARMNSACPIAWSTSALDSV